MKLSSSSLASLAVLLLVIQGSPQQVQEATVKVTEKGYEPAELKLRLGSSGPADVCTRNGRHLRD